LARGMMEAYACCDVLRVAAHEHHQHTSQVVSFNQLLTS